MNEKIKGITCPNCGMINPLNQYQCINCGRKLPKQLKNSKNKLSRKINKRKTTITIILILFVLSCSIVYGIRYHSQSKIGGKLDKMCFIYQNRQRKTLYMRYLAFYTLPHQEKRYDQILEFHSKSELDHITIKKFEKIYKNNPKQHVKFEDTKNGGILKYPDGHYEEYKHSRHGKYDIKHWRMIVSNDPRVYFYLTISY